MDEHDQGDLWSQVSDLDLVRHLLADMHDDLKRKVLRFKYLTDISADLGSGGIIIPGGEVPWNAWIEARSSFINGNYLATIMLAQSIIENILAAYLSACLMEELPEEINFRRTIEICVERGVLSGAEIHEIERLVSLRNPISHYRGVNEAGSSFSRIKDKLVPYSDILSNDAWFSISLVVKILAKKEFSLGR